MPELTHSSNIYLVCNPGILPDPANTMKNVRLASLAYQKSLLSEGDRPLEK